jgi:hypothetical protein
MSQGAAPRMNSLAMRVLLFFAVNPRGQLSSNEVLELFNLEEQDRSNAWHALRRSVHLGWLHRERPTGMPECVYRAGPELLREIRRHA